MNENQKLPSDALKAAPHPARTALIAVSAVVVAVALAWGGGSAWAARQANTADAPRAIAVAQIPVDVPVPLSPDSVEGSQVVDAAQAEAAAEAAAQAAAAAASREAARQSNSSGLPAGAAVPLNSFGSPDTTKCASGSASDNAAGVAICD